MPCCCDECPECISSGLPSRELTFRIGGSGIPSSCEDDLFRFGLINQNTGFFRPVSERIDILSYTRCRLIGPDIYFAYNDDIINCSELPASGELATDRCHIKWLDNYYSYNCESGMFLWASGDSLLASGLDKMCGSGFVETKKYIDFPYECSTSRNYSDGYQLSNYNTWPRGQTNLIPTLNSYAFCDEITDFPILVTVELFGGTNAFSGFNGTYELRKDPLYCGTSSTGTICCPYRLMNLDNSYGYLNIGSNQSTRIIVSLGCHIVATVTLQISVVCPGGGIQFFNTTLLKSLCGGSQNIGGGCVTTCGSQLSCWPSIRLL